MPRRKRRDKPATERPRPGVATPETPEKSVEIDPAVALFAARHQAGIEREKDVQRKRAAKQRELAEHGRLVAAKDDAVAAMKRINRTSGSTQEDRDAAEVDYRTATADLIAHETGNRPTWAPDPHEPDPHEPT